MSLKKYCISNKKMNPAPDNDYKTNVNECHAVAIMDGSGIHLPNEAKTIKFCRKISSASLMTKKNALVRAMESWNHSLKVEAIHDVLAICP